MVTSTHEASHRIFQERPEILAPVFKVLGIPLPEKATVDALVPDVTELQPLERRVDSVLRVAPSDGDAFLLAIESQGSKKEEKESSWPYYVAHLRSKYREPVLLLVVCQDRATAKWATGPFTCGARGWTAQATYPLVVGPHNLPLITEPRAIGENVAMTVFSAIAHSRSREGLAILDPLARFLSTMNKDTAEYYFDLVDVSLAGTPAAEPWSDSMQTFFTAFPGRGTVRETAYLEGKAEGKAEGIAAAVAISANALLSILDLRSIHLTEADRERITTCADLDTLGRWIDRALTVHTAQELFAEDGARPASS